MTKKEAAIITAYTGVLIGTFEDYHKYVEQLLEGPVYVHELKDEGFVGTIREKAKADFVSIKIDAV